MMSLFLRIIDKPDLEDLLAFEAKRLQESIPDEAERSFAAWTARWREESLAHYIQGGWSYVVRERIPDSLEEGPILGYFLAQALLFVDGQTQSLWVEHMQFSSLQVRDQLCDVAIRLSREKHFQRVYLPAQVANSLSPALLNEWQPLVKMIKTTKVSE